MLAALVGLVAAWAAPARAVEVESIRDDSYQQLSQGDLKSMALSSDGFLVPSYGRRLVGDTHNEIVWDVLREKSGAVLCATGHHGKLVRLTDEKSSTTLGTFREPELTALAPLGDGAVLIAAAPTGRIYKLDAHDKLTTFTQLSAKFVWRMIPDADGSVWVVTGTEGRLFKLREEGGKARVEEVCKFKSANLLDLWVDRAGLLGEAGDVYVAGQNPGWLYRWRPSNRTVEVAYNAQAEEIRRLLPTAEGLALALNTERSPSSQALSLTLRMSGGSGSAASSSGAGASGGGSASDSGLAQAFSPTPQGGGYGMSRSEIVILDKSGFTRSVWTAPERPIHDLALSPDKKILASAGNNGRVFEVAPKNGEFSVVADLREDYVTRIHEDDKGYLLAAARNGVVADMARERAGEAVFLSRALDAGKLARWGHLYWKGELALGQRAELSFRQGNDGDTDSSFWGPWTPAVDVQAEQAIALPAGPARFLQYKLTLRPGESKQKPAQMEAVVLYFMGRNSAPHVLSFVASDGSAGGGRAPSAGAAGLSEGREGPSGMGLASSSPGGAGGSQSLGSGRLPRTNTMAVSLAWRVVDPNGDTLRYDLYYRAADEQEWKLVDKDMSVSQMTLSVSGLADGRYRFRVVASDELGNPPGEELQDEAVSNEVVVDNTPPVVEARAVRVEGTRAVLTLTAADKTSLLATVRVDLDGSDPYPLQPLDGVMDEQRESFSLEMKDLKPGEHVATISVTDARGNSAVDKVVFTVAKDGAVDSLKSAI